MIENISFEATGGNNCEIKLQHSTGETTVIEFNTLSPMYMQDVYIKALAIYMKKHPDFSDKDIFGSLTIWLAQHNLNLPFGGQTYVNYDRQRIGKRIQELREERNWTPMQLSNASGIDVGNIIRIEHGKYSVPLDVLTKLAKSLGCKLVIVKEGDEACQR